MPLSTPHAKTLLEKFLETVTDSSGDALYADYNTAAQMKAKHTELILMLENIFVIPKTLPDRLEKDAAFQSNDLRHQLDTLRLYCETALQLIYVRLTTTEEESGAQDIPAPAPSQAVNPKHIFVVYGRDTRLRKDVFAFLRALELSPIEWSTAIGMTGQSSPYVGDVLERAFMQAQAVLVVLSPDDRVALRPELWLRGESSIEREFQYQARPNVLFEAGMAFGRNPHRTVLVQVGAVKPFSDVLGRHILHFDGSAEGRKDLAHRLKDAGCDVKLSGSDWLSAGSFEVDAFPKDD